LPAKPRLFYGWWIVAVCFLASFVASGYGVYLVSIFLKPLQLEFGWGRDAISLAVLISMLVAAPFQPIRGRLVDRYGPSKVMAVSALIGGIGYALLSYTQSLWYFYIMFAIFQLGLMGAAFIPASAAIAKWFHKRRGTAMGIATTGHGVGGMVLAPIVGSFLIPAVGWRTSYLILGLAAAAIIAPLALWIVKTRPSDMGLHPDGITSTEIAASDQSPPPAVEVSFTLKQAIKTPAFWLIPVAFMASGFCMRGLVQHHVVYLENDIGYSMELASAALGLVGMGSAIGKFGFGWLSDRINAKYCAAISYLLMGIAVIILMNIGGGSPVVMVYAYAIIMGLAIGGNAPLPPVLVASNFGLASFGTISGTMSLIQFPGGSTGPYAIGSIFEATGSYQGAFVLCLVLSALAILTILAVRRPQPPSLSPVPGSNQI